MNMRVATKRAYRQGARAEATGETGRRILDVFFTRLQQDWFEDIRLDDVAMEADVTVQTVIRRYGGKDGLLNAAIARMSEEVTRRRRAPAGDLDAAVAALVADYETVGDLVMRLLAQEERFPAIRKVTDVGRREHRAWVEQTFAAELRACTPAGRRDLADALVVATDLYTWKLLRRDMGRSAKAAKANMLRLARGAFSQHDEE